MARLRVSLLGNPRAELDHAPVSLGRQKAWALLAYLGATNAAHRRDSLAALLWPDASPAQSRASLRRALATLTKALPGPWWCADRSSIALLDHPDLWVDVREALRLSRALGAAAPAMSDADLARLVSLLRARFLEGFTLRDSPEFDAWQELEAAELQGLATVALERRIARLHDAGEQIAALEHARRWLALDVLSEACHTWIMRLYAAAGQRTAALQQYRECVRLLARELGVEPELRTTALYHRIRDGAQAVDPMVDEPARAAARQPAGSARDPGPAMPPSRLFRSDVRSRIVGRDRELTVVEGMLERSLAGRPAWLVIRGEPGVGKTQIGREAALAAEDAGILVLRAECAPEDRTPYACLRQIVRQVLQRLPERARELPDHVLDDILLLAPELRVAYPAIERNPPLDRAAEQRRLVDAFLALCAGLTAQRRPALFIDDLHWIDPASLALLRHLRRNAPSSPVALVATVRDGEAAEHEALGTWLGELDRDELVTCVRLEPLRREHVKAQLQLLLDTREEISEEFLDAVYRQTGGNPFFLQELCKSLLDSGDVYFAGGFWRRKDLGKIVLPEGVRSAIMARVEGLPAHARELLAVASVLGQRFSLETLTRVTSMSEAAMSHALDRVEAMQFFRPRPGAIGTEVAFAHPLIPFAVRASMGALRLQRLHLQVADALRSTHASVDPETLARHYLAGGEMERGLEYTLRSADRAVEVFAYASAIEHLQTALGLLAPAGDAHGRHGIILERLADMYVLSGEHGSAIETLDAALEAVRLGPATLRPERVRLHRKVVEAHAGMRDRGENERFAERAAASIAAGLQLVDREEPGEEDALFLAALAKDPWGARSGHDGEAAVRFAQQAVRAAERAGSITTLSRALSALGASLGAEQRLREQVEVAGRRLALSRRTEFTDRFERLEVLCESGAAFLRVGEYTRSLSLLLEAERLAASMRAIDAHVYSVSLQAECLFYLDRWREMLDIEAKQRSLVREYTPRRVGRFCFYCGLAANVLALQGRLDEARQRREEAHDMMSATMGPVASWPRGGLYCRGNAFVGLGDYGTVRDELERALDAPASWVGDHDLYAILADIAVRQRCEVDLRRYAPQAERSAAEVGHRLYAAVADRAWGVLHTMTGDVADSEARLTRALAAFRSYGAQWQMGRTFTALAELARSRGERGAETAHLSEAIRLFDLMGATVDGERARRQLAARGVRPRRP